MLKVDVESVKSLKKCVTEEGEIQPIKGVVVFDVSLEEAGKINGKTCYIYTEEEHQMALGNQDVDIPVAKALARKVFEEALKIVEL